MAVISEDTDKQRCKQTKRLLSKICGITHLGINYLAHNALRNLGAVVYICLKLITRNI